MIGFMKILFVVDTPNWAFDNIAKNVMLSIKERVESKIIYTNEYSNYADFIKYLNENQSDFDIIHFFWRDYLMELLEFSMNKKDSVIDIFINKKITTHIPDHLYLDNQMEIEKRYSILNFVDGYFTTSSKIFEEYSNNRFIQSPLAVIFDNPKIKNIPKISRKDENIVKIVWIGNSKWGEYLNYVDYKGLNKIVKPAVKTLRKKYKNIQFKEFDKAKIHTDNNIILQYLSDADILLISSIAEGTPLPLIEAMANNCAIITTDVGISYEVLPVSQQPFIIDRSEQSFVSAIEKLIDNPELLEKIKIDNVEAYENIFGLKNNIGKQWLDFFNKINKKDRIKLKQNFCGEFPIETKIDCYIKQSLSLSLEIAKKLGIAEVIKKNNKLNNIYYNLLGKSINSKYDYILFDDFYKEMIKDKSVIALYSGYWLGVANSTTSFFGDLAIPYPLFSSEYPQVTEHSYFDNLVDILSSSDKLSSIILSGGTLLQQTLAKALKNKNPNIKLYFLWHGSPSQWCDLAQYNLFNEWNALYRGGIIDGFITCKPELEYTLIDMGILTHSIINYMPEFSYRNVEDEPSIDEYKIGFFAALFSWYKNPFPQLTSLASISGCHLTTNLELTTEQISILSCDDINFIHGHLSNKMFVEVLSRLHVVLYVTNTECSPMIALESISVGTPCIVGPAGNIYKGNKRLEKLLVVNEVDNPYAISKQLEIVREHYKEIKGLLDDFKTKYNLEVHDVKYNLLKDLSND